MTSSLQSGGACLDNNHSHYILVDNGTINQYGVEISFRANLENCIARKTMLCGKLARNIKTFLPPFPFLCNFKLSTFFFLPLLQFLHKLFKVSKYITLPHNAITLYAITNVLILMMTSKPHSILN